MTDNALQDNALAKRFGQRLRAIRRERGLTQFQFAVANGFQIAHYSRIENGLIEVRLPTMGKLARSFGIELSELLQDVG